MELFQIQQTANQRAFKLIGELDLSSSQALAALENLLPNGDVHLELADLQFIDGVGLECFRRIARRIDGTLYIENARTSIEKLLRRTVAHDHLENLQFCASYSADELGAQELPDPGRTLVTAYSPESLCRRLIAATRQTVEGAGLVSVILRQEGRPSPAACSHTIAGDLDVAQIKSGDGPSLEALRENQIRQSPTLIQERRWSEFTNKALYGGVASVLSVPLVANGEPLGVLSLYGQKEDCFSTRSVQAAADLVRQSAFLIANSILYWDAKELAGQMSEALKSRAIIEQAKGLLMGREAISADEAFLALRTASQRSNLKIRDLAHQIMAAATGASPEAGSAKAPLVDVSSQQSA